MRLPIPPLLRQTWDRFSSRKGPTLAAAIAYRAVFALAPLLLVAVSVAGAVFGDEAARGLLADRMRNTLGSDIAETVEDLVASAARSGTAGILGVLLLIWTGSGLFAEVQGGLREMFDVSPTRTSGIRRAVVSRLKTLAAVLLSAVLLTGLVAAATATAWLRNEDAARQAGWAVSALVMVGSLGVGFRYLTVERPPWRPVAIAATATALAALLAGWAVGAVVARSGSGDVPGIAGGIVAVLFAVYALANVLLLGAALTKVLSERFQEAL
ncbi:MAG TPA: YihY/virulence factor BrkB family protein [Acidimicrobiia bacterium]|nr:YihY/virulence factor BrkB family protein [Acidimicrobiia bacterium]